jgi:hypothetical protein
MFTSDTLARAASANLLETTGPKLIADTISRAPESPPAVANEDLWRLGIEPSNIGKPESRVGRERPEPSPKKSVPGNVRYYDLKRNWTISLSG